MTFRIMSDRSWSWRHSCPARRRATRTMSRRGSARAYTRQRSHGRSRRLWHLLRPGHAGRSAPDDPLPDRRVATRAVRRAGGLPDQPVQWRDADVQFGARELVRFEQQPVRLHRPAVHSGDQQPVLGDAVQPPGVGWHRASVRHLHVVPIERCLHRRPQRGIRSEHQSRLRSGDRRELQQQRRRQAAAVAVRSRADEPLQRPIELLRVGERVHAPNDQSPAGIGDLHAFEVQGRDARAVAVVHREWPPAAQGSRLCDRRRHGRRVHGWRPRISVIAPCSTESGKRRTDCR